MKWNRIPFAPPAALLLVLSLASCDQMFSSNLFAKITHPTPSAADIAAKSPSQLLQYVSSPVNVSILADNPALKSAALGSLAATYSNPSAPPLDRQTAAVAAADVSILTVPSAKQFSASILGALATSSSISTSSTDAVSSLIQTVLPPDVAASLASGDPTPPANFIAMVEAYTQANAAYSALGADVAAGGGYAAGINLGSSPAEVTAAKSEIAVNAVISGLMGAIVPANPNDSPASALWSALTGNGTAFTISTTTMNELTSPTSSSPVASLVKASSLGNLLGGSK